MHLHKLGDESMPRKGYKQSKEHKEKAMAGLKIVL